MPGSQCPLLMIQTGRMLKSVEPREALLAARAVMVSYNGRASKEVLSRQAKVLAYAL